MPPEQLGYSTYSSWVYVYVLVIFIIITETQTTQSNPTAQATPQTTQSNPTAQATPQATEENDVYLVSYLYNLLHHALIIFFHSEPTK